MFQFSVPFLGRPYHQDIVFASAMRVLSFLRMLVFFWSEPSGCSSTWSDMDV